MAEARSLCRIDWKLGQALMPDHFLWQEDSLRREWETRAAHSALPMWGVVDVAWDEALLKSTGRLLITRLQLVFEMGTLVDVPGNARPVSLDLPKPGADTVDVYLHLESEPERIKGNWSDREGSLVELRGQKLALATQPLRTPLPGFRLLRLRPYAEPSEKGPNQVPTGWTIDPTYAPPLVNLFGLRDFGVARFERLNRALEIWKKKLCRPITENALGIHKRVEASLYLRQAHGLSWYLSQVSPALHGRQLQGQDEPSEPQQAPAIVAHPFDFFSRLVSLYLDVFAFRCGPLQTIEGEEPAACPYDHEDLAKSFDTVEAALLSELDRAGAGSSEWSFEADTQNSDRLLCKFPLPLQVDSELYFLVQFKRNAPAPEPSSADGLDSRLLGLKLAAPERLESVQRRVLPGIALERVHFVPFPHDYDPATVQFYRLNRGPEWKFAQASGAIAYYPGGRPIERSFLYSPDVRS